MKPFVAAVLCVVAGPVAAHPPEPSNYDAFAERSIQQPVPGPLPADVAARVRAGHIAHVEERLGVPTFFWAPAPPRPVSGPSFRDLRLTPEEAARRHLFDYAALYRQPAAILAESPLHRIHDTGQGAIIVSFRKVVDGVRVFRDELKVIMNQELELVALSGYLPPHQKVGVRGEPSPFLLSHATALAVGLFDATGVALESSDFHDTGRVIEDYHHFTLAKAPDPRDALRFNQPARVRKVLFTLPEGLVAGYYVELDVELFDGESRESRMVSYVVSAADGSLLFRKNLTASEAFSYKVWADANGLPWDGPHGTAFSPHPAGAPNGLQPQFVAQQTITLQNGPISTNDPWLPAGATVTRGNNVDAYADLAWSDGFGSGDLRASVTGSNLFDFTYDPLAQPNASPTQIQAAVTQLFVNNNFFHDWYYDVGFDEAAGNAQQDNYGRGGIAGDVLRAEAQDFSGNSNANMSTPADGARPRMQMYIFSGESVDHVTLNPGGGSPQTFNTSVAQFGPSSFDVTAPGSLTVPADACAPITNDVSGKIVVIDRGTCTFTSKAKAAQDAGAVGVIIANNTGNNFANPLSGTDNQVVIPVLSVSRLSGVALKNALNAGPANLRMFRESTLDRDGTLDNAIVAHEWGHYISNRLIGDANGLNNLQGVGMGEGWGDFHGLLVVVREEDSQVPGNEDWQGVYALSTFVTTGSGGNGLYYGIRRLPYSTDFSKNALTFRHIQNGVPLPPGVPTAFGASGNQNAEVHNTGEVWATMLWECYAALLRDGRLTFQQAQDRMRQYLVAGYKGTPNSPTFLEARDAILAAAWANDPEDYLLMSEAFARRGAGHRAVAPGRYAQGNQGVVEDFTTGSQLSFVGATLADDVISCDDDGVLDNGETGHLTLTLRNAGINTLSQTTAQVTTQTPGVSLPGGGAVSFPPSTPFGTTTAQVEVKLEGATDVTPIVFHVSFDDADLEGPPPEPVAVTFRGNVEETPSVSTVDTVEAGQTLWTVGHDPQLDGSRLFRIQELSPVEHVWFGPNPESPADVYLVSPELEVSETEDLVITFRHRHDFEYDDETFYDGGLIELRANRGPWMDIGAFASPGYNGQLAGSPSSNPLRGRAAYAALSPGYPAFVPVTIELGREYAGAIIQLRFRIGADDAVAHRGWEIDDIGFQGIIDTPFTRVSGQKRVCGNHAPVVNVPATLEVPEGKTLTLTGTGSDEDDDTLTFRWEQVSGPPVTLQPVDATSVTFTAPMVTADTTLQFAFIAHDGKEDGAPGQVDVVVKNLNHRPVAVLISPGTAKAGNRITLDGSRSHDEDGEPLTFEWTQTDGPAVTLEGDGATRTFVVPEVTDARFAFQLVVHDGIDPSEPAVGEIIVGRGAVGAFGCGCVAGTGVGAGMVGPAWALLIGLGAWLGRRRR